MDYGIILEFKNKHSEYSEKLKELGFVPNENWNKLIFNLDENNNKISHIVIYEDKSYELHTHKGVGSIEIYFEDFIKNLKS